MPLEVSYQHINKERKKVAKKEINYYYFLSTFFRRRHFKVYSQ